MQEIYKCGAVVFRRHQLYKSTTDRDFECHQPVINIWWTLVNNCKRRKGSDWTLTWNDMVAGTFLYYLIFSSVLTCQVVILYHMTAVYCNILLVKRFHFVCCLFFILTNLPLVACQRLSTTTREGSSRKRWPWSWSLFEKYVWGWWKSTREWAGGGWRAQYRGRRGI